uniref:Remorin C-terminal domain-containing protein n=2 Tax=Zea mays TaxID=4577 RepID=A0A804NT12_MAIZE
PPPRLFWLLASLSVAEQTCAVTARHRHHFIQCPLWLCVSINLSVCFPAFWCRTASRPLLLFRASSPPGDDGPKLRRGQRETPAGSLRQGEAEAVQVGRRAAVALLLPCARRRRPAPELLRGRPPPAAVGIAEGATLVERRGRRRRPARGAGARRAGRRGCGGGDQEGGLRSGVRAAAPVPLAAGRRHGDDAGREQRAIQGQHPTRNPTGHAAVHGGARDPRTAAPTGFVYGRRWIATRPSGSGPRRDGARCADDDGRVARGDVGRRRARQAHGQVSARGDENTGLGKPATAKGGAANEGGRGTSSHGHMFHQPRKKVWTCGSQPRTRYGPFDPNNGRKLKCSSLGQAKAERMKLRAQEKTASKLASAQAAAREKRAQAEAKLNRRAARVDRADALRRTGHLPSSSSVFSLKLPLMCR